jgi:hypothetical protein
VLPLTSTLPDMKADTTNYIHLQNLYKRQAEAEKAEFKNLVVGDMDDAMVDSFVKNAHAIRVLKGRKLGAFDEDAQAIGAVSTSRCSPRHMLTNRANSGGRIRFPEADRHPLRPRRAGKPLRAIPRLGADRGGPHEGGQGNRAERRAARAGARGGRRRDVRAASCLLA